MQLPFLAMSMAEKTEKNFEKPPAYVKPKNKRLSIRNVKGRRYSTRERDGKLSDSAIPRDVHRKIWGLFAAVEREFEKVCIENAERKLIYLYFELKYFSQLLADCMILS